MELLLQKRLKWLAYLLTHSLTPCSTTLLEKLTVSQLFKKFDAF